MLRKIVQSKAIDFFLHNLIERKTAFESKSVNKINFGYGDTADALVITIILGKRHPRIALFGV
jgi:hypothetical protein